MEELSHIYLKHPPSKLQTRDGFVERSYKKTYETQAYWVGAAALLPLAVMINAKRNETSRYNLASSYGVSTGLVKFRENVTGTRLSH